MEILKRGKRPQEFTYIGICTNCRSELRAKCCELRHTSDQFDGENHTGRCPVCDSVVYFELEK